MVHIILPYHLHHIILAVRYDFELWPWKFFSHRSHSYSPLAFRTYCSGSGSSSWIENWFGSKPILSIVSVSLYPAGLKLSSFPLSLNPSSKILFFSADWSLSISFVLFWAAILSSFSLQIWQVKSVGATHFSASKKSRWISVVFLQWIHFFSFGILFSWSFLWSLKSYERSSFLILNYSWKGILTIECGGLSKKLRKLKAISVKQF